jgi:glycerophosphoryl diester phosphodiesterase
MAQFVGCLAAWATPAVALDFPIVSGNVSLYNESKATGGGSAILPDPAIGGVGLLDDWEKRDDWVQGEGDLRAAHEGFFPALMPSWALMLVALACMSAPASAAKPVTIVAHRGLAEGVAENTLAAFRHSIEQGVRIIELDLRVTSDGQLVVMHDKSVDRTTDGSGRIDELTLAHIRSLKAGPNGDLVPTFAEVLALVEGTPVRILADVKAGTPLEPVLREIREQHAEQKVILGLRSIKQVARARAVLPGITVLAYMPDVRNGPAFAKAGAHIIRLWSDWVEADPRLIAGTRALGPQVWIMVGRDLPSNEREWRALHARMIAAGAQGLITDRSDLISAP